ncbi:MAG: hypothetical protein II679_05605 [Ruminococcus sp.]|nr:hypothetical protein [Ruminococcus sp.]
MAKRRYIQIQIKIIVDISESLRIIGSVRQTERPTPMNLRSTFFTLISKLLNPKKGSQLEAATPFRLHDAANERCRLSERRFCQKIPCGKNRLKVAPKTPKQR